MMVSNNVSAASMGRSLRDLIDCNSFTVKAFRWYMLTATIRASNVVDNSEYRARSMSESAVRSYTYSNFSVR